MAFNTPDERLLFRAEGYEAVNPRGDLASSKLPPGEGAGLIDESLNFRVSPEKLVEESLGPGLVSIHNMSDEGDVPAIECRWCNGGAL